MDAPRGRHEGTPLVSNRMHAPPAVGEPFLAFYAHYGETLCGPPVSEVLVENGRRCQYFEHLALEEGDRGGVRLKPLGRAWLEARRERVSRSPAQRPEPRIVDVAATLPRHATRTYPTRPLDAIRYIVLHHTGAGREVDSRAIAEEHVRVNDWPGIGYHFVIDAAGTIHQTQDLSVASYHARQFNPASVGIALVGDLSASLPSGEQMAAVAEITARLLLDLGLPVSNVRGHREMVATPCPGDTFLAVWKPRLVRDVTARLEGRAPDAPEPAWGPEEHAVAIAPVSPEDPPGLGPAEAPLQVEPPAPECDEAPSAPPAESRESAASGAEPPADMHGPADEDGQGATEPTPIASPGHDASDPADAERAEPPLP